MSYHRSTYSTFNRAYGGLQQNYADAEQFNYEEQLRIREEQIQNYEQRRTRAEEEIDEEERQRRIREEEERQRQIREEQRQRYEQRREEEERQRRILEQEERQRQIREEQRQREEEERQRRIREEETTRTTEPREPRIREEGKLPKNIQAAFNGLTTLDKARLSPWYRRLVFITDKNNKVADFVYKQISECLKDADSNHELADILYMITDNAHNTCDDRVALSVIYLGLQQSLNECKKSIGCNLPYVYNLLINGFLTIELLYELARYKVAASQNIDEIEVYLGYLIKTKKVLEIPINLNDMVFPDLANISSDDVAVAVERVQKMRNDSQTCHQFLIQQPIWIDILTNKFKDAVETITNIRNNNDDYVEALNTYTKSMVELSIHCYRNEAASSNPGEVATQNTRQAVEHDIQN